MTNFVLLPIQILLSLFLLFALSRAYLRFRDRAIGFGQFLFWCGLWLLALFTIYYPDFTNYWAKVLGIGRGVDVILYVSIIILFYLVFRVHVLMENVQHDISRLVREIALVAQEKQEKHKKRQKPKGKKQ